VSARVDRRRFLAGWPWAGRPAHRGGPAHRMQRTHRRVRERCRCTKPAYYPADYTGSGTPRKRTPALIYSKWIRSTGSRLWTDS